ncbi:Gram-negative bacterial tonB protein [Prevotella melaninogenica]|uniref:TonB family protein n=1 Tax=Prevotella melaninogenica TaxID=28132 RepID=UPI0019564EA3|nr:TonB family protein [Prevotella melaninogenica]VTY01644.1 Gram-negative bacterial tonB protein [Prevotella melaninogenica]
MMKKLFLVLFLSFVVVGNIDAQKHKRTMKSKKKEQTEQPYCAEPAFALCYDTLNVDTLGAKMFETAEGLKPSFRGNLLEFSASNLQYPPELAESTVSGRVIIKFFVTPSGRCCLFRVMRSVDPFLDREALRVLKLMPAWEWERRPKQGVWQLVPVIFRLQ